MGRAVANEEQGSPASPLLSITVDDSVVARELSIPEQPFLTRSTASGVHGECQKAYSHSDAPASVRRIIVER